MTHATQHADRAHAVLSASSSSRWLHCTPSARASEGLDDETSEHAELGTLAHEYSENILRYKLGFINEKTFNATTMKLRKNKHYTTDLDDEVEPYVELVLEQVAEARATTPDALVLIEEKVSLEVYVVEGTVPQDLAPGAEHPGRGCVPGTHGRCAKTHGH